MKADLTSLILAAGFQLAAANDLGGCHSDNCARAVTGTRLGLAYVSSALADCSAFMTSTETLPATTTTITKTETAPTVTDTAEVTVTVSQDTTVATITETDTVTASTKVSTEHTTVTTEVATSTCVVSTKTVETTTTVYTGKAYKRYAGGPVDVEDLMPRTVAGEAMKREAKPELVEKRYGGPPIPTYASACTDAAAYSTACSCWGITAATVTVANPTCSTVFETTTITPTATVTATATDVTYVTKTANTVVTVSVTITSTYTDAVAYTSTRVETTTLTVTSVSTVSLPSCTNKVISFPYGRSYCGFNMGCYKEIKVKGGGCDYQESSTQPSATDCAKYCAGRSKCNAISYNTATKQCTIFHNLRYYSYVDNPLCISGTYIY